MASCLCSLNRLKLIQLIYIYIHIVLSIVCTLVSFHYVSFQIVFFRQIQVVFTDVDDIDAFGMSPDVATSAPRL